MNMRRYTYITDRHIREGKSNMPKDIDTKSDELVIGIRIGLSVERFKFLWHKAVRVGYLRNRPERRWTEGEMKEAIRWYIEVGDHDRKDQ